jgi:hypothetical protein
VVGLDQDLDDVALVRKARRHEDAEAEVGAVVLDVDGRDVQRIPRVSGRVVELRPARLRSGRARGERKGQH